MTTGKAPGQVAFRGVTIHVATRAAPPTPLPTPTPAADTRPLRVQVAEALGCGPVLANRAYEDEPPEMYWACGCNNSKHGVDFDDDGCIPSDTLAPYGDDTPEGYACTMPLFARWGWSVRLSAIDDKWEAVNGDIDSYTTESADGDGPCEAIARLIVLLHSRDELPR